MRVDQAVGFVAVTLVGLTLTGCAERAGGPAVRPSAFVSSSASPSASADPTPSSSVTVGASVSIGSLPRRSSLLLHGEAVLAPLDPATQQDLQTLARQTDADPDDVVRDYAAQPAFDETVRTMEAAHVGFADAVFRPGEHAAGELRFTKRPPQRVLDALQRRYPRDLRIEWGEHLAGDDDRDRLSGTVFDTAHGVPHIGHLSTGIVADGGLDLEYDGDAAPQAVADAVLAAPLFRRLFVDGRPPTVVRVTRVAAMTMTVD